MSHSSQEDKGAMYDRQGLIGEIIRDWRKLDFTTELICLSNHSANITSRVFFCRVAWHGRITAPSSGPWQQLQGQTISSFNRGKLFRPTFTVVLAERALKVARGGHGSVVGSASFQVKRTSFTFCNTGCHYWVIAVFIRWVNDTLGNYLDLQDLWERMNEYES